MLPGVRGRPLTLVRCPEGYRGQCFYQKHGNATVPEALRRIPVAEKGGVKSYLVADDLAGLVALVQMGVLEIHVWGATERHLEHPDPVTIDPDPDQGLPCPPPLPAPLEMPRLPHHL